MRLAHPLLLVCLVPVAAAALAATRAAGAGRRAVVLLRVAAAVLVVLALSQPQLGSDSGGPVVLAVERSAEMPAAAQAQERLWLAQERREDCAGECRVVQFGAGARLTSPAQGLLAPSALGGGEADPQEALQLALARAGKGGQVAVLSAGLPGAADLGAVAAQARAQGARIDAVALTGERRTDAAVTRLQAPGALHAGDPLPLEVTVEASIAASATLTLSQDGTIVGRQTVKLAQGENPLLLSLTAPAAGEHSYTVRVSLAGDEDAANDALSTTVHVAGEPTVLLAGTGSSIGSILTADGIHVTAAAASSLPSTPSGYAPYDAVVLDDVSAAQIGATRARALDEAVHAGSVGLLALGGPHSFSLGGYYESPLQQALPVSSLEPGNLQQRHLGVELVLDRSGSMIEEAGGVPKLEMAQVASVAAAHYLAGQGDELGIVDFDIEPHVLVPVTKVTPGRVAGEIERRIEGLIAEGGTNVYKALALGAHQIEASSEPQRHIVLITDGVSEPGSYSSLLPELRRDHITVSTVALGSEADFTLLKAIAQSTGGQYYATDNAGELPRIFAKETRVKARPVQLHGHIALSAGAASPILSSLAGQQLQPLAGNVVTTLKTGAQADLLAQDPGHASDPALAQWQYGIGRVATWTPGLSPQWAASWAGRAQLWQDALRWVERGVGTPALTPVLAGPGTGRLRIDTIANADVPLDLARIEGELIAEDGRAIGIGFTQTGPSEYEAAAPELQAGVYRYTVSDGQTDQTGLLAVPYPAADRPRPSDASVLGGLAAATGGRELQPHDPLALKPSRTELWRWPALAAALAFLAAAQLGHQRDRDRPPRDPEPELAPERRGVVDDRSVDARAF
jgi:Ca-activated chloride channel family protein